MKKDNAKQQYRVNEQIRVREVRIVGDGIESTVMPTRNALHLAEQKGVDLVEISPNAQPPVCRLIDYSKFLYQQKKHQKEMKAKQVKVDVKEIRFGPQTDDHDYEFKLKHAKGFLTDGDKVKAFVFFKGRSILFKEQGEVLLLRFAADLEDYGKVEQMPQLEGKRMIMFIAPKTQRKYLSPHCWSRRQNFHVKRKPLSRRHARSIQDQKLRAKSLTIDILSHHTKKPKRVVRNAWYMRCHACHLNNK